MTIFKILYFTGNIPDFAYLLLVFKSYSSDRLTILIYYSTPCFYQVIDTMVMNVKLMSKAVIVGVVVLLVLLGVNGVRILTDDFVLDAINLDWKTENTITATFSFITYTLEIVAGLVAGFAAVLLSKDYINSMKDTAIFAAVAGLAIVVPGSAAKIVFEILIRPVLAGYVMTIQNAVFTVLYACTDAIMLMGLCIAGGVIYAAFILNR